ncbi:MAG: M48 family metalloprotease [Acidimicrobiales bacterium]
MDNCRYRARFLGPGAGLAVLAFAVFLAPRPGRLSKLDNARSPTDLPVLFELCAAIARQIGARPPVAIVIDEQFNVGWRHVGWSRRPVLIIGAPLWAVLGPEERVAVLAHEMGHERNGDATNSLVIGTAVATLDRWRDILTPGRQVVASTGFYALAELLARLLMHSLCGVVRLTRAVLVGLAHRANPISEYIADRLSAQVAGADAVISSLKITSTAPLCMAAVRIAARADGANLWEAERTTLARLSNEAREKLLAQSKARGDRVDDTHPATWRRIEVMNAISDQSFAASAGDDGDSRDDALGRARLASAGAEIDGELAADFARVARVIKEIEFNRYG